MAGGKEAAGAAVHGSQFTVHGWEASRFVFAGSCGRIAFFFERFQECQTCGCEAVFLRGAAR